jgi:acetyl esterase/lipase
VVEWDKHDRARTPYTLAYVAGMRARRDKEAFEGAEHTLRTARQRQAEGDHGPTRLTRLLTEVSETRADGMTVWRVRPRRRPPAARVLYVHGGGYVHPLTADYWRLVRALCRAPAEVVVPAYPLAPEATVDEVLPRLVELYDELAADRPELPVVLMGDSAGGALVLAIAQQLRDRGGTAPARVVALSPWLDAELRDPEVRDLEPTDPMLAESGLRAAGRWWAGDRDPAHPLVSPVHANLAGLPPVDVFIGDRDILRPAVDAFARRADEQGADVHVHEVSAMFHVWMTRAIPEARRTRQELTRLVLTTARAAAREGRA